MTDSHAVERVHPPDALMRVVNPLTRRRVRRGKPAALADRVLVLHFRGRLASLTNSGWRRNFRDRRPAEITLAGERIRAEAALTDDPDEVANIYEELIDDVGLERAGRELGIRINVDRRPAHDELRDMVERSGLSVLWYDLESDRS